MGRTTFNKTKFQIKVVTKKKTNLKVFYRSEKKLACTDLLPKVFEIILSVSKALDSDYEVVENRVTVSIG